MVHRLVSKSEASTPEAAVEFIQKDTGGQVQHAQGFDIIDEGDHWRVPVFSLDGRASMPFPVGAVFPNDNRISDAEIERQVKQFGRGDDAGWTLGTATGRGFRKQ